MSERIDDGVVQAAGAVVWRAVQEGDADHIEVLVVHRPRYDDWTFPKGKLERGEEHDAAAIREVEEETGFVVVLDAEVANATYVDHLGRPKTARYYVATVERGGFVPNDEVDVIAWVAPSDLPATLSYGRDVEVAAAFDRWWDAAQSRP